MHAGEKKEKIYTYWCGRNVRKHCVLQAQALISRVDMVLRAQVIGTANLGICM